MSNGCCINGRCLITPFKKANLPSTVAKGALAMTVATVFAVVIGALIMQYPNSAWAIIGSTGAAALVGFITLIVALTITCVAGRKAEQKPGDDPLPTSTNPFNSDD